MFVGLLFRENANDNPIPEKLMNLLDFGSTTNVPAKEDNRKRSIEQQPQHQTGKRAAGKYCDGAQPETEHRDDGG